MTARETAVSALASALDGVAGALLRDASRPESIPAGGLIVLREGVADAPEATLSPATYHYRHPVTLEIYVSGADQAARISALDALLVDIGSAITDRTLGGAVDWTEVAEAAQATEDAEPGTVPVRQALVTLHLHYHAASALA